MSQISLPISEELFKRLIGKFVEIEKTFPGKTDFPFLSVAGRHYADQKHPRIMFIGKATAGSVIEKPSEITKAADCEKDIAEFWKKVAEGEYHSLFWSFLCSTTRRLWEACGYETENSPQWALDRLVWNNVMKIGMDGTQPVGEAANMQRSLCKEILQFELKTLKPTIIIAVTNNYEWHLINFFFDKNNEKNNENILPDAPPYKCNTWHREIRRGVHMFWTRHPQGWKREYRDREVDAMCEILRERPTP